MPVQITNAQNKIEKGSFRAQICIWMFYCPNRTGSFLFQQGSQFWSLNIPPFQVISADTQSKSTQNQRKTI